MKFQVFKFSSFLFFLIYAINLYPQGPCGTTPPVSHVFASPVSSSSPFQTSYSLPIHFYIITSNGALPGINEIVFPYNPVQQIRDAINYANTVYAPANISFYPSAFTFHESSSLYNNGTNVVALYNAIHDDDAINVYIVNDYIAEPGVKGRAIHPDPEFPINNALTIIATSDLNYTSVLSHELGHYFNLLHTFHGTAYLTLPETDCSEQGDKICDTPQDAVSFEGCPNTIFTCSGNCNFDCSSTPCEIRDLRIMPPNNNLTNSFAPDKKNIMSYFLNCGLDHFSPNQLQKNL
ncbi:M43 family zinc metalloprotease [Haliscomenobacter sp.]|uniref:M43 family zinc metalloprotease n=1 Tax=Haliscomenobacter sp. TaxID=2717303 RepID=UPI0035942A27